MKVKVALYCRTEGLVRDQKSGNLKRGYRLVRVEFKKGKAVLPEKSTGSFYLRYRVNGKRRTEPLEASDLEAAVISYKAKATELDNAERGLGSLNPPTTTAAPDSQITLGQALDLFIGAQQNKEPRTREAYEATVREFVNFCGAKNLLTKTGRPCALAYRDWLYKGENQDLSDTTRVNKMTVVSMFLSGIENVYPGLDTVYKKGEWPKPNRKDPDAYSDEQIETLLRACESADERLLIQMFLFCGGRRNEVKYLQKSDIQIRKNEKKEEIALVTIKAKPEFGFKTKGKKDRTLNVPLEFAKELLEARSGYKAEDLLFPNTQGGPNAHLDRIVHGVGKRAKIDTKGSPLHRFRRTYATFKSNEINTQTIQRELGHKSITTTMRYLAAALPESAEARRATNNAFGKFAKRAS